MVCPGCGFQNPRKSTYCEACGCALTQKPKKKNPFLLILGIIFLAAAVFIAVFSPTLLHKHTWMRATCAVPMTCSECGETQGTTLKHNWVDATCTAPETCSQCGETQGNKLDHSWTNASCQQPRTCRVCGETSGSALEHSWSTVTCTEPKACSVCGEVAEKALGHQWEDATYNDPKICRICDATDGFPITPSSTSKLDIRDIIKSSQASSVYAGDNLGWHGPENMYDNLDNTNWTENAEGYGIGESVTFYFKDTYALKEFRIKIGSHYSQAAYKENGRPKIITLTFSDGSSCEIYLKDTYNEQVATLDRYYYTDYVILTIDDVYSGTRYPDTIIAELDFIAYPAQ